MKISLLVLRCKDIEISKTFYEQLGLVFVKEKHGNGPEHYSSENDGVVFELYPNKDVAPNDNSRIGFKVGDIEKIVNTISIISTYQSNNSTTYIVADPDGRKIELKE